MSSEPQKQRLHARISGRVQGVGFRYFVLNEALVLGLTGWVRNCFDGDVEVLAEGEFESLERLLVLLRQGPRGSFVSNVDYSWSETLDAFTRFSVRSSAY